MSRTKRKSENQQLIRKLNRDGFRIAQQFGLQYRCIEAERANVKRRYGICYSDGTIRIRLRHVTTGKPLKYSSLIDTLCHELAHLRHFDHSERFHRFYAQVLSWAKRAQIYVPGAAPAAPDSASLRLTPRAPSPWERPPARSGPAFESDLLRSRRSPPRRTPAKPPRGETPRADVMTAAEVSEESTKPVQLSLFG